MSGVDGTRQRVRGQKVSYFAQLSVQRVSSVSNLLVSYRYLSIYWLISEWYGIAKKWYGIWKYWLEPSENLIRAVCALENTTSTRRKAANARRKIHFRCNFDLKRLIFGNKPSVWAHILLIFASRAHKPQLLARNRRKNANFGRHFCWSTSTWFDFQSGIFTTKKWYLPLLINSAGGLD